MLDLLKSLAGCPPGVLQHLTLPSATLILYPSEDAIVVCDACTLAVRRVLAFEEVYPASTHQKECVTCIAVDAGMKIIVASMNARLAAWSLSESNNTWRVHSSLILPDHDTVTTLDCRSGLLAVGSQSGLLSVYTLILENDLPTWSKKWSAQVTTPCLAKFAPSLGYIATTSHDDTLVRLYSTPSGEEVQSIPHPRPVTDIIWRSSQATARDDLALYTITSDSTLRVFLTVIDSPDRLELHASLDLFSSLPLPFASKSRAKKYQSKIIPLDRVAISRSLQLILKDEKEKECAQIRRLQEIVEEGWDLFLRILSDGTHIVNAITNIDRRPPTLLRSFVLQQSSFAAFSGLPSFLYILENPARTSLTLVTSSPLKTYQLFPSTYFDGQSEGLRLCEQGLDSVPGEENKISRLVRTPAGRGIAAVRSDGGQVWRVTEGGSNLVRAGQWSGADHVVVLRGGKLFATYSSSEQQLTLHSYPKAYLPLTNVTALFSLPHADGSEFIIALTQDLHIVHILISESPHPALVAHAHTSLPLTPPPKLILPVDPMAWSKIDLWVEHDVLLSVSDKGDLAFWVLEEENAQGWRCTGRVKTGRKGFRMARCSSAKKSVLVVQEADGEELTIWDSKESEFAAGLEYRRMFSYSEPINDLDWTSTPSNQSILAVGFAHHVELLCQQRKTYFDDDPMWAICYRFQLDNIVPYPISDSIWLTNGSLLVGAGHQLFLYGQQPYRTNSTSSESLFEYVARQNGPLEDYHPQMLLQCLLWDKVELVKQIIVNLARCVRDVYESRQAMSWSPMPVEQYLQKQSRSALTNGHRKQYSFLTSNPFEEESSENGAFSRSTVLQLIEQLETQPLPHLSPNEHAHLLVLIQTTLEIDEQRRALDANGLRYVISMRSFYILNRRITSYPSSPQSNGLIPRRTGWRERLRYGDMIWAFHSESQELLLNTATSACNGKMCWSDARALGIPIWLNSIESMRAQMEVIARNEYLAGENRDPAACSIYYFALGKVKLVHGLWRQAAWHKEQAIMLKFLSNDFTQPRWRTAALKNAYTLLSKQRFEYAAAFFLLGNSLKDAVNVCVKQLSDFQLAIALARVVEQSQDGPVLREILNGTVIPIAFRDGNRWLGSWAFWMLHRRDLAVRILLTPLRDIADELDIRVQDIDEPYYDDPSLALLFSQLRSKTLQAAQGTSEISGRAEFNFVLQMARVFRRMGCHVLALDLVRSWSFERPSAIVHERSQQISSQDEITQLKSPPRRRPTFSLEPALRRQSSIMIDMEIPSIPSTRKTSPERPPQKFVAQEPIKEEADLLARKAGIGSLMKTAKQDVQVPEFDMNAFF